MDGWVGRWMDGWMNGRMDGWMAKEFVTIFCFMFGAIFIRMKLRILI
jgi:hypothetical protein